MYLQKRKWNGFMKNLLSFPCKVIFELSPETFSHSAAPMPCAGQNTSLPCKEDGHSLRSLPTVLFRPHQKGYFQILKKLFSSGFVIWGSKGKLH